MNLRTSLFVLSTLALLAAPRPLLAYARSVDAVLLNQTSQALVLDSYDQSNGCWGNRPPARIEPGAYGTWDAHGCNEVTGPEGHVYYRLEQSPSLGAAYFYWDNPFVGSNSFDTSAPSGYESAYVGGKANRTTIFYFIRPFSAGPMLCNPQWIVSQLKTSPNDSLSEIDRLLGFITNPFKERGISGWVETGCTAQVVGIPVRDAQHSTDDFWTLDLHLVSFSVGGLAAPDPASRYLRIEIRGGTGAHAVCDSHQISIRDVVTLSGVVRIDTDGPFLEVHPQADFSYTTPGRDGALETASCQTLSGWALDGSQPGAVTGLVIDDGLTVVGSATANLPRSDSHNGHGFSVATPGRFLDHHADTVHIRYSGTSVDIPSSPVALTCLNNATFGNWQGVPWTMTAGQTAQVSVTMLNNGNAPWSAARGYKLGSQAPQDNLTWGTNRVYMAPGDSVGQGQGKTFTFGIRAPAAAGSYAFQWKMVEEMVEWFGGYTPRVDVQVAPAPPAAYVGCFTDTASRALPVNFPGTTYTVESCLQAARTGGYVYAGLQYGGYCFAGNSLGYSQVADAQCNMPCTALANQTCGGSWLNSVYSTGVAPPPICNASTDCNTIDAGGNYCRSFSTNVGASWSSFAWASVPEIQSYCQTTAQQCVNKSRCGAVVTWCQYPGSAGARWSSAPTCTPVCSPTTCAAQGATCGTILDGCGGTLNCGGCTAPATCGGGTPNACGLACDANTDCQTLNAAGQYCRSFSTNAGASWSAFAWSSVPETKSYCETAAQQCVNKSRCSTVVTWCQWPGSTGARWSSAATCTP